MHMVTESQMPISGKTRDERVPYAAGVLDNMEDLELGAMPRQWFLES
jgi:hypothetical protein